MQLTDSQSKIDERWMQHALNLALKAQANNEVPVGAVIIDPATDEVLGEGFNQVILNSDPTAHAEVEALRAASKHRGNYRLPDATLYVTLEPCAMCAGALVHARIARVVIATEEPRAGAAGSVFNLLDNPNLNHRCEVSYGPRKLNAKTLLKRFFIEKRF